MANFQQAFNLGLRASEEAALSRKAVDAVFEEFARQVLEASGGAIKVVMRSVGSMEGTASAWLGLPSMSPLPGFEGNALVASVTVGNTKHPRDFCRYDVAPAGYPVVLRYANVIDHCHDKGALERGLESLLAAPQTGDVLRQLLQFAQTPPPPDQTP